MPKRIGQQGFTLIELLMVISIIAILSGVVLSNINYIQHKKNAEDAIRRTNLEKLVTGLESYRVLEGKYPTDANGDGDPSDDPTIATYIKGGWLNDRPIGAVYTYVASGDKFSFGLVSTANSGKVLKYYSSWAQIKDCPAGTLASNDEC